MGPHIVDGYPTKKSAAVKSIDLAGQCKSPKREIRRPGNAFFSISDMARAVCTVAPASMTSSAPAAIFSAERLLRCLLRLAASRVMQPLRGSG
ncbi:hypothetical protein EVAR_71847_1 [Eumeta japonica]|uniref:Uncharacterized protein n=1 Tax=Eumeta variegata TaxID=151549 RepID=A0A4C1TPF9_EUMVA|nr:hypothetical protein EVAR_71847_1 [Eumeta japonica]